MILLFLLFVVQLSVSCMLLTATPTQQRQIVQKHWNMSSSEERNRFQQNFDCCGFSAGDPKSSILCPNVSLPLLWQIFVNIHFCLHCAYRFTVVNKTCKWDNACTAIRAMPRWNMRWPMYFVSSVDLACSSVLRTFLVYGWQFVFAIRKILEPNQMHLSESFLCTFFCNFDDSSACVCNKMVPRILFQSLIQGMLIFIVSIHLFSWDCNYHFLKDFSGFSASISFQYGNFTMSSIESTLAYCFTFLSTSGARCWCSSLAPFSERCSPSTNRSTRFGCAAKIA